MWRTWAEAYQFSSRMIHATVNWSQTDRQYRTGQDRTGQRYDSIGETLFVTVAPKNGTRAQHAVAEMGDRGHNRHGRA